MSSLSHFDEKGGIVRSQHEWGSWYQTVEDVVVDLRLAPGVTARHVRVNIQPHHLEVKMADGSKTLLSGKLFTTVKADDSTWTLSNQVLSLLLTKANHSVKETLWTSLLEGEYHLSDEEKKATQRILDLEHFAQEYPGRKFK